MAPELRPLVVLERVAAKIKHAVNAARTAKNAALEPRKFAPVQCGHGLGLKIPVAAGEATRDECGTRYLCREP